MKIAVAFGTRPEIIKLSPVIRALQKEKVDFFIIHSNQHYDKNMDAVFLKELKLPKPKYNLKIGSGTHANMTGRILIETEKILLKEKPDIVIVQGDTNTVLAVSLAATKLKIKIAHVESGLRSHTKIPEETNRILTDRISDFCFAPTKQQEKILTNEGTQKNKIFVVGNTIVDAVFQNLEIAEKKSPKEKPKKYFLMTTHREENVDNKQILSNILKAAEITAKKLKIEGIFPVHPRTAKKIKEFHLKIPKNIIAIEPVGYLGMLILMKNAEIIITDSGGIQEEACTLKVPCVTIREATERPETVETGGNIVVGTNPIKIVNGVNIMRKKKRNWKNPFGRGNTGEKIADILIKKNR